MKEMATSTIELQINNKKASAKYDPEKKEINYDFSKGLKIDNRDKLIDGAQSPALGFWSEVYHSFIDQVDAEAKASFNGDFDAEEEYVHVEKEGRVIDALKIAIPDTKETKRSTYGDGGKYIKTKGTTSAETK